MSSTPKKPNNSRISQKELREAKMMMFARWISTCYADSHIDSNGKSEADYGFNFSSAMSVLNRKDGKWWKDQLKHFETTVYPNYRKQDMVKKYVEFLNTKQ